MLMCFQSSKCIFILVREQPGATSIANSTIYIHFRMSLSRGRTATIRFRIFSDGVPFRSYRNFGVRF